MGKADACIYVHAAQKDLTTGEEIWVGVCIYLKECRRKTIFLKNESTWEIKREGKFKT